MARMTRMARMAHSLARMARMARWLADLADPKQSAYTIMHDLIFQGIGCNSYSIPLFSYAVFILLL